MSFCFLGFSSCCSSNSGGLEEGVTTEAELQRVKRGGGLQLYTASGQRQQGRWGLSGGGLLGPGVNTHPVFLPF